MEKHRVKEWKSVEKRVEKRGKERDNAMTSKDESVKIEEEKDRGKDRGKEGGKEEKVGWQEKGAQFAFFAFSPWTTLRHGKS